METYLIYTFNSCNTPKVSVREVQSYDIVSAISCSGVNTYEIISVKLKATVDNIVGI